MELDAASTSPKSTEIVSILSHTKLSVHLANDMSK